MTQSNVATLQTQQTALTPAPTESARIVDMVERMMTSGASIEQIERLLDMRSKMRADEARRAFAASMATAKGEIGPIAKKRAVDFTGKTGLRTNYKFEDMALIAEIVDPVMARCGLSYRYKTKQEGGRLSIGCVISHADGHEEETWLSAGNDDSGNKNSIQAIGSTATYLQRYTLKLAMGLAAGPDTDGKLPDKPSAPVTEDQAATLREWIETTGSDEKTFLAYFKAESVAAFPSSKFEIAVAAFKKKQAKP